MDDEKKNLEVAVDEPSLEPEPTENGVLDENLKKEESEPVVELVDELPNDLPDDSEKETKDPENEEDEKTEEDAKKRKVSVVIFVILGIMLAIAIFGFIFSFKQKTPLEKFAEDFKNTKNVSLESETNVAYKKFDKYDAKNLKIVFSTSSLEFPADLSGKVNIITTEGDEIFLNLDAKLVSASEFYLKFSNVENFLDDMNLSPLISIVVGEEVYSSVVRGMEDEWVKFDADELSRLTSMLLDRELSNSDISTCLANTSSKTNLKESGIVLPLTKAENNVPLFIDSDKIAELIKNPINCFVPSETTSEKLAEDFAAGIGELPTFYLEAHDQNRENKVFTQVYSNSDNSRRSFSSLTNIILDSSHPDLETPEDYLFFSDLISEALGKSVDE